MVHEKNDILVIAEEEPWVKELLRWLEKNRYFASLGTPDSALSLAKQARPAFLILDASVVGGWTLAQKLKAEKNLKDAKILVVALPEAQEDLGKAASAADYLVFHPLSEHSILFALQTLADAAPGATVPLSLFQSLLESLRKQPLPAPAPKSVPPASQQKSITANLRRLNSDLEKQLLDCQTEFGALEKDLDSFAYSVSHDLRAPLRAIEGFSRIVMEDFAAALDPEGQKLLGYVQNNAQQMMRLIEDIVSFYRVTRSKITKSPQNVGEMARSVWQELAAKQPTAARFELGENMPPALADPKALRQILTQLLSNAIKFTRDKGEGAIVEMGSSDSKGETVYCVKDNGIGFDMQYAHRLFKLFQRLRPAGEYEGNGVGLVMVQRLVARHGGRVWAEGAPDAGSAFYFALPKSA